MTNSYSFNEKGAEDWRTWRPKNDYEFYMYQISKLYVAGIISTEECNEKMEKLKVKYNINNTITQ